MSLCRFLSATALMGSFALATPALAQAAPSDTAAQTPVAPTGSLTSPAAAVEQDVNAQDQAADSEILVTGSRIRSTRADAAVPVTSITATELLGARGDVSVGDALNQLPQFRATFSQANSTASIGTAGLSLLDLRGLGAARTLTLVNGRRVVTAVILKVFEFGARAA